LATYLPQGLVWSQKLKTVILKPVQRQKQEFIGCFYEHDASLNKIIRKLPGAKWSQTHRCWCLALGRDTYNQLYKALTGKANVEISELKSHLQGKKRMVLEGGKSLRKAFIQSYDKRQSIHPVNAHVLPALQQQLKLKGYSDSTIKTYTREMGQLLLTIKKVPADSLTGERLRSYLVYCYEKLKLSENTLHSRINAMKFYYEQVLRREKFFGKYPGLKSNCNCQMY
jgi:putative IMPACT (imprinted ancient) family translation regulator